MDSWLTKQPQKTQEQHEGNAIDFDDGSSDTLMADSPDINVAPARSTMKAARFTALNQPWRRNSHNAALFDSPTPEGSYHTYRTLLHPPQAPLIPPLENGQAPAAHQQDEDDANDALEDDVQDADSEDNTTDPILNTTNLHAICETIFASDPKLLPGERLVQLAALYTNAEILEKFKLAQPDAVLPSRIEKTMPQALAESINRVARQKGVEREVVRRELDRLRAANGVGERQTQFNARRKRELAREREEAAKESGGVKGDELEGMDGDDSVATGREGLSAVMNGSGDDKSTTPYGLGASWERENRSIADSEESEQEL